MNDILKQLQQAILAGEPDQARELAAQALEAGIMPLAAIEKALNPGMEIVGERYESGEYFIPDLVMAAEAMKGAMEVFEPVLIERQEQRQVLGTVVIGTVEGDIHEIGKSLVATMLSAAGFQVYDLGVDVPANEFVKRVQETGANVVGLSALLTTTMRNQEGRSSRHLRRPACASRSRSSSAARQPVPTGRRPSARTLTPKTRMRRWEW